ncbi:MAG: flavodoxin family protein [Desulfovibrionales bacterium]
MAEEAIIFCCSPRAGGNSDAAGQFLAEGVEQSGGRARLVHLRNYRILPCLGCGRCRKEPGRRCFQEAKDQSRELFSTLFSASLLFFSSPVFFYHVPAHFKAFIDRGQSFYLRKLDQDPALLSLPKRPAYLSMVAGRPKGERLFEGSELTVRYFLEIFNFCLEGTLFFRGIDKQGDLEGQLEKSERLRRFGGSAWKMCTGAVS